MFKLLRVEWLVLYGRLISLSGPQQIKDLEKVLTLQKQGKPTLLQHWSSFAFRKNALVFGVPALLVATTLGGIATVEHFLYKNPNLEKDLRLKQMAYGKNLLDMSNPWGTLSSQDPAAFLMAVLGSIDPTLKGKFKEILSKLSTERIAKLAQIFNTIEFSEQQKARFARLLVYILGSDGGTEKLDRVFDIMQKLSEATRSSLAAQKDQAKVEQALDQVEGQVKPAVPAPEVQNGLSVVLLGFLDIEDPAVFDQLMEMLVSLPQGLYEEVMKIVVNLPPKYSRQLVDLVQSLNQTQTTKLVKLLENVAPPLLPPLLDQLLALETNQLMRVVDVLDSVPSSDMNVLAGLVANLSKKDFLALVSIAEKTNNAKLSALLQVGKQLSSSTFASATQMLDSFNGHYASRAIDVMSNLNGADIPPLVDMQKRLTGVDAQKGIDILYELRTSSRQSDLLKEAGYLSRENLSKGIQVMDDVKIETVSQMVGISKGLSNSRSKNQLADQMYRIRNPYEDDTTVRGTVYTVRTPTAVAGVRGKALYNSDTATSGETLMYPYQTPKLVKEAEKKTIQRIENLVQKIVDINDNQLNEKLLARSDDLDSRGLVRGADVYIDLELGNDKKRAHRLVDTYGRTDVHYKTSAIDTLHDIDKKHVNAAVDIVSNSDDQLLKDSIAFSERLKHRLGNKEGLDATQRAINVASRVKTNEERQRGLEALSLERDVRVRRILKQVDGNMEPPAIDAPAISDKILFNHDRIMRMTDLYLDLRDKHPQESSSQRTPAIKLADVLSSSDGLTLGAKDRAGTSRFVTQERKLFRIAQYLDEPQITLDFRVTNITERPIQVTHGSEDNFVIKNPDAVEDVKTGVFLIKPETSKAGL